MRPVLVVIADVFVHEALQMALMENNHMIEQVATTGADPALGHAVLPRTAEAGSLGLDAEALYRADDFLVEIRAAIKARGLSNLYAPREVKFVHDIPKLGTGKVNHRELQKLLAEN